MGQSLNTTEKLDFIIKQIAEIKTAQMAKQKVLDKPIIGDEEFIQIFGITKRISKTWRETGIIKYLIVGDNIYYKVSDVEALLNKNYIGEEPINLNYKINKAA